MLSTRMHVGEGTKAPTFAAERTKALALAAVLVAIIVLAAFVAQADITGSRAAAATEKAREISQEHTLVCQRLGHQSGAPQHGLCLKELTRLKQWHDAMSTADNDSIL
jgi:hypothetical protein